MGRHDTGEDSLEDLPKVVPIFPLKGVLLLPYGYLPLNIFEPRYKAMVDAALKGARMIGMIQPSNNPERDSGPDDMPIFGTGCAGKITAFEETTDGRYLITLTGICRFDIKEELALKDGYRRVIPEWTPYAKDREHVDCLDMDRDRLHELLAAYFMQHDISCDWDIIDNTPDNKLITSLAMICPLDPPEKQALLEVKCCFERARLFLTLLEMAVCDNGGSCPNHH